MKYTETFTSATATYVKFDLYLPTVLIRYKAIVQIHHGTGEHSGRYQKFAEFLAQEGYVVVVTDFPGHGSSLYDFEQGYFGSGDPLNTLVADMQRLRNIISSRYPELPYFIIGNQFGSLVLRKYMAKYGDFIQGAILMGTCGNVRNLNLAKLVIKADAVIKGQMHRSKTIKRAIYNHWTRGILNSSESYKTKDDYEVQNYREDPMTEFIYTNSGYSSIIRYIKSVTLENTFNNTPNYLSIYITSGRIDVFGQMGKGPKWLYHQYKKYGNEDVELKIYNESRQDILHELNRKDVYQDIANWLNDRTFG